MTSSHSKKAGGRTILWWIVWIAFTIAAFFIAAFIWTPIIAAQFGSIRETKASVMWVIAVFGTWMIILVPLIVVMYQKVDKAYEDARMSREKAALRFRSIFIPAEKRKLSPAITAPLNGKPETIEGGYLVDLLLKDGRSVPNVFVSNQAEILGIYDAREMTFSGADVKTLTLNDMTSPPDFLTAKWLRLDGVTAPE